MSIRLHCPPSSRQSAQRAQAVLHHGGSSRLAFALDSELLLEFQDLVLDLVLLKPGAGLGSTSRFLSIVLTLSLSVSPSSMNSAAVHAGLAPTEVVHQHNTIFGFCCA
jgi:hypothetical protein